MSGIPTKMRNQATAANRQRVSTIGNLALIFGSLVCVCVFPISVAAQSSIFTETSQRLSANNTFETDLAGWSHGQTTADRLTRDWSVSFSTDLPGESNGALGSGFVRLRGAGRWEQVIGIASASRRQLLNLQAFQQPVNGTSSGDIPFMCVSYYDSSWNHLDSLVLPIDGKDPVKNRGFGDGMNFTSWGIDVPLGAANVHLYIENYADTEVYFDDFGLFDYRFQTKAPISPNLIANLRFSQSIFSRAPDGSIDGGSFVRGYGIEFWQNSIDWSEPFEPI